MRARCRRSAALALLGAVGWVGLSLTAPPASTLRPVAEHRQQACPGLLVLSCSTPSPATQPSVGRPAPLPVPPVTTVPALPATSVPVASQATPATTPTPTAAPTVRPTPSPTPITVGLPGSTTIAPIEPIQTGDSLDGGALLIRLFFVLAALAVGSVASIFALR